MFIIQDLEEYQHVMAKRTYTTEKAGPSTTNRFVQRTYTPTKVVTGATTKLADIQPDLTGKRKVIQPQDSAGGTPPGGGGAGGVGDLKSSEVDNPGQWVAGILAGISPISWAAEMGVAGKDAKITGKDLRGKVSDIVNSIPPIRSIKEEVQKLMLDEAPPTFGKGGDAQKGTYKGDPGGSDNLDDPKIICTMMNRMYGLGEYRIKQWLLYSNRYLKEEHQLGYHKLYCKLVSLMPSNKLVATVLSHIADKRTDDIVAEMKGTKRNWLGRLYRLTLIDKPSYLVGICIKRNWIKPADVSVLNLGRI